MAQNVEHLIERLNDLTSRIDARTNDPEVRLTWLHWSDVQILREAIGVLKGQEDQVERARAALRVALNEIAR